ncbi:hypothetical protein FisN_25Lh038 [Fistulifera solaris]|uniref:Uncharacterized protein n=1 Tax=Fistulifera solaris TaxID=1519565 RepID=A0A1Z5JLV8_FISSO|nr:hypothetical protein FisN_25Lh038 [Fistulifera solaris]|eukprot:GAX14768.1 hypothetical protein FisN_25Lh038 [Fistulifera solaris]
MLTNVPPYLFELDCQVRYLERKTKPSSVVRAIPQISQPFLHAWRRSSGNIIQIQGTWTGEHCEDTQQYKIKVKHAAIQPTRLNQDEQIDGEKTIESFPLNSFWVTLDDLQAGYFCAMASESTVPITDTNDSPPFFIQYKVPRMKFTMQQEPLLPRVSFVYEDRFHIELQVLPSKQAPHAGYGLFAYVNTIDDNDDSNLPKLSTVEIPPGVLIDLGVYGPLRPEDRKPWPARLLKSFIYSYHCGSWFFETSKEDDAVFDMTDDATGQLHELARRNVLMYANETSGLEQDIQSLWPIYDPEGAVHFYLGHPDPDQGPLLLPIGSPVELLVDYGAQYEQERVRKNYPRVTGNHLQHIQECLAEEDQAILQDLQELSLEEMEGDAIPFLKHLVQEWGVIASASGQCHKSLLLERALIVTLILIHNHRGKNVLSESNLNSLRTILSNLCSWFPSDQHIKSYMTSNVAYQELLRRILGDYDWNSIPALLFRRAIVAL